MKIDACCTIGLGRDFEETAQDLIGQMDSVGVDMAVIHPADCFYAWENEARFGQQGTLTRQSLRENP